MPQPKLRSPLVFDAWPGRSSVQACRQQGCDAHRYLAIFAVREARRDYLNDPGINSAQTRRHVSHASHTTATNQATGPQSIGRYARIHREIRPTVATPATRSTTPIGLGVKGSWVQIPPSRQVRTCETLIVTSSQDRYVATDVAIRPCDLPTMRRSTLSILSAVAMRTLSKTCT